MKKPVRRPRLYEKHIDFKGGIDITTPMLRRTPGKLKVSKNIFQDVNGGYHTPYGYERFDGQAAPSAASYAILNVTLDTPGNVSVGDIVSNIGVTIFGTVIAIASDESYLVITKITGTFAVFDLYVGAVKKGTSDGAQVGDGASTRKMHAQYTNLAADEYRGDITSVDDANCTGPILGVFYYSGTWYVFRNLTAGGVGMYKSSASGWTAVALGYEANFTSGSEEPSEGDELVGQTSTETFNVARCATYSGSWGGGTAAGNLIITTAATGAMITGELLDNNDTGTVDVMTISEDFSAITIPTQDGSFEFCQYNFSGASGEERIYGVDGQNRAFEFDGTIFTPIETGASADNPQHVFVHKYQLFLSFWGNVLHSGPGEQHNFSAAVAGDVLGIGDNITGMNSLPGAETTGALEIVARNSTHILYGNNIGDWNLVQYKNELGALEWTLQKLGNLFAFDDRGIIEIRTAQEYGNFQDSRVSDNLTPWLKTRRTQVTCSFIVRELNQYWICFSDKTAVCCTVKKGRIVAMAQWELDHIMHRAYSAEDSGGNEVIMLGSESGYVYQFNKGSSFDGADIAWEMEFVYDNFGQPFMSKVYRRMMLETSGEEYTEFMFSFDLDYESSEKVQGQWETQTIDFTTASWDSGSWDTGIWDGSDLNPKYFMLRGTGKNISLKLKGESDYFGAMLFSGAILQYQPTKELR